MPRAAILGTGLIGASVGIALGRVGWTRIGWDPDRPALEKAMRFGAVDEAAHDAADALEGADLVVLAGPVAAVVDTLRGMDTDALVTDVAGVKTPVVDAGSHLRHFVAGHPMAGRETSGPEGSSGDLFRGATWVLCTDGADAADLERMTGIVSSLGAVPAVMSAAEHDVAVAAASHLPHVVAGALVRTVGENPDALALAAGGFRDLTRVVTSDPGWWIEVLVSNGPAVAAAMRRLAGELTTTADLIDSGDAGELRARLDSARHVRSGMSAPVEGIGVILADRPGEMARVGHALSESGVDLRDLQLRHATHGGGGVLTLSVRVAEAEGLRAALREEGFELVETV